MIGRRGGSISARSYPIQQRKRTGAIGLPEKSDGPIPQRIGRFGVKFGNQQIHQQEEVGKENGRGTKFVGVEERSDKEINAPQSRDASLERAAFLRSG